MSDFHDNMRLLDAMSFYAIDPDDPDGKKSTDTDFARKLRREMVADYDALAADAAYAADAADAALAAARPAACIRYRHGERDSEWYDAEGYCFCDNEFS